VPQPAYVSKRSSCGNQDGRQQIRGIADCRKPVLPRPRSDRPPGEPALTVRPAFPPAAEVRLPARGLCRRGARALLILPFGQARPYDWSINPVPCDEPEMRRKSVDGSTS